jgi:hypothetical protein
LVDRTGGLIGDVPIARELMSEGTHAADPLNIGLAAQRIDADATTAKVSGREGEIGDREHRGRALAVLGNAEPIIDRRIAAGGIEPRRLADEIGRKPETFSTASGLLRSSETNSAQSWNSAESQRSRTKASLTRPSVTITWASEVTTATLVPGCKGR